MRIREPVMIGVGLRDTWQREEQAKVCPEVLVEATYLSQILPEDGSRGCPKNSATDLIENVCRQLSWALKYLQKVLSWTIPEVENLVLTLFFKTIVKEGEATDGDAGRPFPLLCCSTLCPINPKLIWLGACLISHGCLRPSGSKMAPTGRRVGC